jgi:hypothetical protein
MVEAYRPDEQSGGTVLQFTEPERAPQTTSGNKHFLRWPTTAHATAGAAYIQGAAFAFHDTISADALSNAALDTTSSYTQKPLTFGRRTAFSRRSAYAHPQGSTRRAHRP